MQEELIRPYRLVKATGGLDTALGRRVCEASYRFYKHRLEAGPIRMLRPFVRPKTFVIDVGANIGFFTRQFATWFSDGGKVIAVEPDAMNYARSQQAIAEASQTDVDETTSCSCTLEPRRDRTDGNPQNR